MMKNATTQQKMQQQNDVQHHNRVTFSGPEIQIPVKILRILVFHNQMPFYHNTSKVEMVCLKVHFFQNSFQFHWCGSFGYATTY